MHRTHTSTHYGTGTSTHGSTNTKMYRSHTRTHRGTVVSADRTNTSTPGGIHMKTDYGKQCEDMLQRLLPALPLTQYTDTMSHRFRAERNSVQ